MLLDAKHRPWMIGTLLLGAAALALHLWLGRDVPGGLRGGSAVGLWYGVVGSLLMLAVGMLSLHRRLPLRRWLGKRQTWLRGHIWLGLLAVLFIWCHSGYSWGGPLEIALWVVLGLTTLSGLLLLLAQALIPTMLLRRIEAETPIEQIAFVCDQMRRRADELLEVELARLAAVASNLSDAQAEERVKLKLASDELRLIHAPIRAYLSPRHDDSAPLADPLKAELLFDQATRAATPASETLSRLRLLCDERRQLAEQYRLHRWLHLGLLIHIPLTVVLLVLGVVHAVASVYW